MPRDYVKSRSRRQERSGPSGVIWLLMGVLIGLIIAGVFYVKNQSKHPQPMIIPEPLSSQQKTIAPPAQEKPKTPAKAPSTQNLQTQFDFYNVLPSKQVIGPSGDEETAEIQNQNAADAATNSQKAQTAVVLPPPVPVEQPKVTEPKTIPAPKPKTVTPPPASPAKPSAYIVQAAALSDSSDADQLKAQLTLLGFNVNVTPAKKNEKTFHRVWLGPFHDESEAKSIQKQLQENMISSKVLKSGS